MSAVADDPSGGPAERLERWHRALGRWSSAVTLRPPTPVEPGGPIAFIDLVDRQTRVDFARLSELGLEHCEEALFAHEVGHHIRYPHTLIRARQHLRFLRGELSALAQAWGLPEVAAAAAAGRHDGLLNLLYDLLINTALRRWYEAEFIALYRTLSQDGAEPIFGFYLALYEALWYLPEGALVGPRTAAALAEIEPRWRTVADACAQFIANRPDNRCLQLIRFLVALRPFLAAGAEMADDASPEGGDGFAGELAPEDVDRVMRPAPGEAEARAWRRSTGQAVGAGSSTGQGGGGGTPGVGQGDPVRDAQAVMRGLCDETAVALATYRRLASRAPIDVPSSLEPGEPEVPGPTAEWNIGDRLESIDWFASLTRGGPPVPGYTLHKRTWLPADPRPGDRAVPWIELYVDMSGSMPDPVRRLNHSIVAGFILVDAATEAGGRVRVVQYSHRFEAMDDFVASPRPARAALLAYVGGGTRFPWEELLRSARAHRRTAKVVRVVITDRDFCHNWRRPGDPAVRDEALDLCRESGGFVALIDNGEAAAHAQMRAAGVQVVEVEGWQTLPTIARALARALFEPVAR